MNNTELMEERTLSPSESVIMKAIWEHAKEEPISIPDLIDVLREEYGKDYARTTVVTFLLKLSDKRCVRTFRKGKLSYAVPTKSEEDYRIKKVESDLELWYGGDAELMIQEIQKAAENLAKRSIPKRWDEPEED